MKIGYDFGLMTNILNYNSYKYNRSSAKIAAGLRILNAADDSAGLSISEKMLSQIKGLNQASRNAQDGISMIQTADGALENQTNIVQRMRELAVSAASDTMTDEDRASVQIEINELTEELNNISKYTQFNGKNLIDGSFSDGQKTMIKNGTLKMEDLNNDLFTNDIVVYNREKLGDTTNINIKVAGDISKGEGKATISLIGDDGKANSEITKNIAIDGSISFNDSGIKFELKYDDAKLEEYKDISLNLKAGFGSEKISTGENGSVDIQIGANENQTLNLQFESMTAESLGLEGIGGNFIPTQTISVGGKNYFTLGSVDVSNSKSANNAIITIDNAISKLSKERSKFGSLTNRLESSIENIDVAAINMQSSQSQIRDLDIARELMENLKFSISGQAAQAMLIHKMQSDTSMINILMGR